MNKYAQIYKEEFQKEAIFISGLFKLLSKVVAPGAWSAAKYTATRPHLLADAGLLGAAGLAATQPGRDLVGGLADDASRMMGLSKSNASVGTDPVNLAGKAMNPVEYRQHAAKKMSDDMVKSVKKKLKTYDPADNTDDDTIRSWMLDESNEKVYSPEFKRLTELSETGESGGLGWYTNKEHVNNAANPDSYKNLQNRGLSRVNSQWGSGNKPVTRRTRRVAY